MKIDQSLFVLAVSVATVPALAQNVALNKPVTVISGAGSLLSPTPSLGVVTDGVFLAEATAYGSGPAQAGAIRWNTNIAGHATIEIQLGGLHTIDGIIVQADDNDSLEVKYLAENGSFQPLFVVPSISVGFGFRTRPNANQVTYASLTPVNTTTIRVTSAFGDGFFGISELQLSGFPAPCYADCDGNGALNIFDYICFGQAFAAQSGYADCDNSGSFNIFDYICYGSEYSAGCP